MADAPTPALVPDQTPVLRDQLAGLFAQPAVRKSLPALVGLTALVGVGMLYWTLSAGPQRTLYSSLSDSERAQVVATLDSGDITYAIDSATGAISVAEDDLYRARMLVASDGSLATPDSANDMLDSIPLGASRTLEGERLKLARERELMRTIGEIDGIESVRVHLAAPERSVFVRDRELPSASVMVRLARGRSLGAAQVDAIVNLVAGSVPGLAGENVQVVDQNGGLLSDPPSSETAALDLQRAFEAKLREQVAQLLGPLLGAENFTSEVQVELDMQESTSARESYDKEGTVRAESESRSVRANPGPAGGVPGVMANTPPPPAQLEPGAPDGSIAADPNTGANSGDSQSSSNRNYALGREVAVTSSQPGGIARISVAVAVSEEALKAIAPADETKLQSLVSAAVGAQTDRGDTVAIMVGAFEPVTTESAPFYETSWFAMALRYGGALVALLLVMLLGVRPLLAMLKAKAGPAERETDGPGEVADESHASESDDPRALPVQTDLTEQVALARQLVIEQPDRAVIALQRMLAPERDAR